MRVIKCFAQEHNTMSLARAQTQTSQSGDKRTSHDATVSSTEVWHSQVYSRFKDLEGEVSGALSCSPAFKYILIG